jgi:hypothetical protein
MLIAKSMPGKNGNTIVFQRNEKGDNMVFVFEKNKEEPVVFADSFSQNESLKLAMELADNHLDG